MADSYLVSPGDQLEPGDIFLDIPFITMKYPLQKARFDVGAQKPGFPPPVAFENAPNASKDSVIKTGFNWHRVMLLSDGCEVDKIVKYGASKEKRHWLVAPLELLANSDEGTQKRTEQGTQSNKFYIPPNEFTGDKKLCVELRRITPINCAYLLNAKRVASLSAAAQADLKNKLLEFFCGVALAATIICPTCSAPLDPRSFAIPCEPDNEEYE